MIETSEKNACWVCQIFLCSAMNLFDRIIRNIKVKPNELTVILTQAGVGGFADRPLEVPIAKHDY